MDAKVTSHRSPVVLVAGDEGILELVLRVAGVPIALDDWAGLVARIDRPGELASVERALALIDDGGEPEADPPVDPVIIPGRVRLTWLAGDLALADGVDAGIYWLEVNGTDGAGITQTSTDPLRVVVRRRLAAPL